jgi:hypothetical protein
MLPSQSSSMPLQLSGSGLPGAAEHSVPFSLAAQRTNPLRAHAPKPAEHVSPMSKPSSMVPSQLSSFPLQRSVALGLTLGSLSLQSPAHAPTPSASLSTQLPQSVGHVVALSVATQRPSPQTAGMQLPVTQYIAAPHSMSDVQGQSAGQPSGVSDAAHAPSPHTAPGAQLPEASQTKSAEQSESTTHWTHVIVAGWQTPQHVAPPAHEPPAGTQSEQVLPTHVPVVQSACSRHSTHIAPFRQRAAATGQPAWSAGSHTLQVPETHCGSWPSMHWTSDEHAVQSAGQAAASSPSSHAPSPHTVPASTPASVSAPKVYRPTSVIAVQLATTRPTIAMIDARFIRSSLAR